MSVTRSLELVLSVTMPATRSYEAILKDMDEQVERLSDDWERVQSKRRRLKKKSAKDAMKRRMDLNFRVVRKLQSCRGILVGIHERHGNSIERQRAKEEMESRLVELEKLVDYFSKF